MNSTKELTTAKVSIVSSVTHLEYADPLRPRFQECFWHWFMRVNPALI